MAIFSCFRAFFPEGVKVGRGIGAVTKEKDCDLQPLTNIPCNVILYQPPSRFWSYLNSFFKIHKLYYGWLIQILVEWEFWGRKQPQFSRMVFQFSSETVNPLKMWWPPICSHQNFIFLQTFSHELWIFPFQISRHSSCVSVIAQDHPLWPRWSVEANQLTSH